jgi:hypothetical protein
MVPRDPASRDQQFSLFFIPETAHGFIEECTFRRFHAREKTILLKGGLAAHAQLSVPQCSLFPIRFWF